MLGDVEDVGDRGAGTAECGEAVCLDPSVVERCLDDEIVSAIGADTPDLRDVTAGQPLVLDDRAERGRQPDQTAPALMASTTPAAPARAIATTSRNPSEPP
jgi:hypothetical protein